MPPIAFLWLLLRETIDDLCRPSSKLSMQIHNGVRRTPRIARVYWKKAL